MQQATNTPMKGNRNRQPCTNFLINAKTHAIPEFVLSNAHFKWTNSTFSYIQHIKSMYLLNVKIAYQCIKEISKQRHKEKKRKNEKKLKQA